MHLWPTTTNTNINTNTSTSNSDMGSEWDHNVMYSTPTSRRYIPGYNTSKTPSAVGTASIATNLTTPMKEEGADSEINEKLSDTSAEVQPTEVSYHPDGAFRTARNIFGPLSTETSPMRDPTPKKRRTRKMALTDVTRSPEKRQLSARIQQPASQLTLHPPPTLNPLVFGARFTPSTEEDEEFRITMEEMGAKKRSFSVFHDGLEVSPGRTESPLEDHRFDFSDGTSNSFTNVNLGNHISPTPVVKPTAMRMFAKDAQSDNQVRRTVSTPHHGFPNSDVF
ncbi:hypothetical protein DID88_007615 [Monilinia fructigena]|uniref:Uncharacterized protein n=1 Tax=Monilinia fructigena TaxID=38457 RepID=A0A395J2Y3_9HELO|nr:hypothetical protein DID88_007615 [Monilinia fructigena]